MSENAYHKMRIDRQPAPAGCPVDHSFSPFHEVYLADPYPELAKRRENTPVFYAEELGYVVVTRMEDVASVFMNPDVFSSENVQDPVLPICAEAAAVLAVDDYDPVAVMSNRARPDHTRIRKYTQDGFSARRMKVLEPFIRQRSEALVDAMLEGAPSAEFVEAIGHPLPGETIFRFIGFPEEDDHKLKQWTTNRLQFTWGRATDEEQADIAEKMLAYWRYCVEFVEKRRTVRADDFTSELLAGHDANPDDLDDKEVESVIYGLSFAGHEIVTNMLCNSLLRVLPDRNIWDALCADSSLIPNAVEEILRFDSPQTSWRRVTTQETELGGFTIPAGTQVFVSLASANRDPEIFDDPDRFDISRKKARQHVSFGRGIHFCLGNRLAQMEARIALETITARVPTLRLVEDQQLTYFPNFTFRGPRELYVTW